MRSSRARAISTVLVAVLVVPALAVASNSAVTGASGSGCTIARYCYNSIETLVGAYFTNITAILHFNSFQGVKDTPAGPCHCFDGFDVQINSNEYGGGEWEQTVAGVSTENSNTSDAGNSNAGLSAPTIWINTTKPTQGCNGPGEQWVQGSGFVPWECEGLTEWRLPGTIPIGSSYRISGSLTISAAFVDNATIQLRQTFVDSNGTVHSSRGVWWLPISPKGQITTVGATIVGPGNLQHADFPPGTNLTLELFPQTNLGSKYGVDWAAGGSPILTGETSNLGISKVLYANSEQTQQFGVSLPSTSTSTSQSTTTSTAAVTTPRTTATSTSSTTTTPPTTATTPPPTTTTLITSTPSDSTSQTTSSSSSSFTTSTSAQTGGIPEFSYGPLAVAALLIFVVSSFLLVRRARPGTQRSSCLGLTST